MQQLVCTITNARINNAGHEFRQSLGFMNVFHECTEREEEKKLEFFLIPDLYICV